MPMSAQLVKNLQRFRLVTFDVTDTLIRLNNPMSQYIQMAATCGITGVDKIKMEHCFRQQFILMSNKYENFGRCTPNMSWQSWWHQLVTNTFTCVDPNIPKSKLHTIAQRLLDIFRTSVCWTHVECAAELVQCIRQAGKCVGIISNFDPSLPDVLDAMGFNNKFDFILTSYEAGVMKPDPSIFNMARERLKIDSAQALHIGNKYDIDYLGARKSGWCSLLVDPELNDTTSDGSIYAFASIADMLHALKTQKIAW